MKTLTLLQKLIQTSSFSGEEEKLAKFIFDYCTKNKILSKAVEGNVVIHLKGKKSDKALIFNAHMDTVTGVDLSGKFIDGKVFGLGASDDKGAIASMLKVAGYYAGEIPPFDLWFVFVKNEETDGSGSKDFLKWFQKKGYLGKYKSIAAVIGEPTGLKSVEIGHRGNAFIKLTAYGITGHGAKSFSTRDLAIEKMLTALAKLKSVFAVWSEKYQDKILGKPTLNITSLFTSVNSLNKIPGVCCANLDIRTTPQLHNVILILLENELGELVSVSKLEEFYPPKIAKQKIEMIKLCQKILPESSVSISLGTNDLGQFMDYGIDAVVLGPGQKSVIHKENEYIELSQVEKAITIYKKIIDLRTK